MVESVMINKSDWTGDETFVIYDPETGKFTIDHMEGEEFHLEPSDTEGLWHIRGKGWAPDFSLGSVVECGKGDYIAQTMGISRDADCPYVAAAQLLCNTI